jgi:hypothetical protein
MGDTIWSKMSSAISKASTQSTMSKKKKQNEYYDPDAGRSAGVVSYDMEKTTTQKPRRPKLADKAPKMDLRKSYPE